MMSLGELLLNRSTTDRPGPLHQVGSEHIQGLVVQCRFNRHVVAGPCWQVALSNDQISSDDLESNNPQGFGHVL
jgi:hypothetical protein